MKIHCILLASLLWHSVRSAPDAEALFADSQALKWRQVFHYAGSEDWTAHWFLDGLKAQLKPTERGLVFVAGPTRDDHASHAVLWTQREFQGDILVEYDYTRLDTVNYAVNILYLHARGKGEGIFTPDITAWNAYREIPYMRHYFDNMALYHISYAALGNDDDTSTNQYVHARRYPVPDGGRFPDTQLGDQNWLGAFIQPGVVYEITAAVIGERLLFSVKPKGESEENRRSFAWDTSGFTPLTGGRIGLRHMWTRTSRYANFRVSESVNDQP